MKIPKKFFRYSVSQADLDKVTKAIQKEALIDGYRQGVAEILYLLTVGEGLLLSREQLAELFENIVGFNSLEELSGKRITSLDAIEHLKKKFDIDVDKIPVQIDIDFNSEKYLKPFRED